LGAIGRRVENQLAAFTDVGLLKRAPESPPTEPAVAPSDERPRRVAPHDYTQPLEQRARSYLDINCAHCHRLGGVGGRTQFQMIESLPLARTGLINGTPLVPLLGPDARVVAPGAPERSELLHRLLLKEGGRMPLIGGEKTDDEGVDLIRRWIASMVP
ncbi:MAG: Quinoprotein glucose dehydrogenase precursor, partial [Verrucomicrobiota bacterium]